MQLSGLVSMCQGFTQNFGGLVACRFLLGLTEAGLLPGTIYLMGMYYKRQEFQRRFGIWFISVPLAGAFGGVIRPPLRHLVSLTNFSSLRMHSHTWTVPEDWKGGVGNHCKPCRIIVYTHRGTGYSSSKVRSQR
jgi:MFS family permease